MIGSAEPVSSDSGNSILRVTAGSTAKASGPMCTGCTGWLRLHTAVRGPLACQWDLGLVNSESRRVGSDMYSTSVALNEHSDLAAASFSSQHYSQVAANIYLL